MIPETHAALWDWLQEQFGFGDWSERDSKVPFFKFRMAGIGQLKRMMTKRRCSIEEVTVAAWYVRREGIPVVAYWQLLEHVMPAKRAWREHQKVATPDQVQLALQEALDAGETAWAERLMRAQGDEAALVVEEWRSR